MTTINIHVAGDLIASKLHDLPQIVNDARQPVVGEHAVTQAMQPAASGHTKVIAPGTVAVDKETAHVAVIDHSTGLMWLVESIGDKKGEPMSHADCEKAVAKLDTLGFTDWRLPTRAELSALVDDTRHEPAIDTNLFPRVKPRWHWTSTPAAWSSASAWLVHFSGGDVNSLHRDLDGFALAVRRVGQ